MFRQDLSELEGRVNQRIDTLEEKLDTVIEAVGEAHQVIERKLDDHDRRITRLEQRAA